MQLTERDLRLINWLTLYGCSTYEQLARLEGTSPGALRRRLPGLQRLGLVWRIQARQGIRDLAVWAATPDGADLCGARDLLFQRSELRIAHHCAVVDVALAARGHGCQVTPPAVIRRRAANDDFRARLAGASADAHPTPTPDLMLVHTDVRTVFVDVYLGPTPVGYWNERLPAFEAQGASLLQVYTNRRSTAVAVMAARDRARCLPVELYRLG